MINPEIPLQVGSIHVDTTLVNDNTFVKPIQDYDKTVNPMKDLGLKL